MTLDKTIKYYEEVAEEEEGEAQDLKYSKLDWRHEANQCSERAKEHRQVAEWLKDLKQLRETEPQSKIGRWIEEKSLHGWDGKSYQCSECGRSIHLDSEVEDLDDYPYCHCGAKMQEAEQRTGEMARGEAISFLKGYLDEEVYTEKCIKAHKMAIKALQQEPCSEAINRQAVLDYIYNDLGLGDEENGKDVERQMELEKSYRYVKSLPPAVPQQKTGHWIRVDKDKLRCSECEVIHLIGQYPNGKIDWCPNCGAKMEDEE